MGRDWSKHKAKAAAGRAMMADRQDLRVFDRDDPQPTKEDLRAEACAAMAAFQGRIRRLPTIISLRCVCGHHGKARVRDQDRGKRFRCSNCGARL